MAYLSWNNFMTFKKLFEEVFFTDEGET